MDKAKSSFILYTDYEDKFEMLSDAQLGKLLRLIVKYEKTQQNPDITQEEPIVQMAFTFIKSDLDRARVKYNTSVKNGSKGGRPKKGTVKETKQNPKKPSPYLNEDVNDNEDVNVDVNDNDNEDVFNDISDDKKNDTDFESEILKEDLSYQLSNCNAFEKFEDEFARTISQVETTRLNEMIAEHGQLKVMYALREAVVYKKFSFDYIDRILLGWEQKGLTVEDYEEGKR